MISKVVASISARPAPARSRCATISPTGTPARPSEIPAVGAMDVTICTQQTLVTMEHLTKLGKSELVQRCTYPLTGLGGASRICTDPAVVDVTAVGPRAVEWIDGRSFAEPARLSGVPILPPAQGETR